MGNSIRFDKIFHTHKKKSKYFWLHKIICQNSDFKWSEVSKIYLQTEAWYYQHICFYKILSRITRSDLKILSYFNFSLFFGDFCLNFFVKKQSRGWVKKRYRNKLPFYNYFKPNFRHLHEYLSKNWSSDCHFEVLKRSKS